ncbi:MAG: FAD-binding oxidoreductase [Bacteroidota bacterium]
MKKVVDYIIVGQGLAGTLLHYFLSKEGKKVIVIDAHHKAAASKVAAGTINPVTGRRYVKSWLVEKLIPFATQTYRALEQDLGVYFYHPMPVLRTLANRREELAWEDRLLNEYYAQYMKEEADLGNYQGFVNEDYKYGEVKQSAQVEAGKLVDVYRKTLEEKQEILTGVFDFERLILKEDSVQYDRIRAQKVLFCEGNQAKKNPFFNYLPFLGAKGEALIVKIPSTNFESMLKQRVFIIPLPNDLYWIGATSDKQYENDLPTTKGKQYLVEHLKEILDLPFEILEHKAAIRPTVKDRRPFLGLHPEYPQLAIFNGLGTKGASLGPYFAQHMVAHLIENKPLMKEVDIERYHPLRGKK